MARAQHQTKPTCLSGHAALWAPSIRLAAEVLMNAAGPDAAGPAHPDVTAAGRELGRAAASSEVPAGLVMEADNALFALAMCNVGHAQPAPGTSERATQHMVREKLTPAAGLQLTSTRAGLVQRCCGRRVLQAATDSQRGLCSCAGQRHSRFQCCSHQGTKYAAVAGWQAGRVLTAVRAQVQKIRVPHSEDTSLKSLDAQCPQLQSLMRLLQQSPGQVCSLSPWPCSAGSAST